MGGSKTSHRSAVTRSACHSFDNGSFDLLKFG